MECKGTRVQDTLLIKVCTGIGPYDRLRFGLHCSSWLPRPLGISLWSLLHLLLFALECIRGLIVVILTATFVVVFLLWKLVLLLGLLVVVPSGVLYYTAVALLRFLARRPQDWVYSLREFHLEYWEIITADISEVLGGRFASHIWNEVIIWYRGIRWLLFTEILHDFDTISI